MAEDHAEIAGARDAHQREQGVVGAALYSTLEPCSFHGRTANGTRSDGPWALRELSEAAPVVSHDRPRWRSLQPPPGTRRPFIVRNRGPHACYQVGVKP